jgi:hypothetical protein
MDKAHNSSSNILSPDPIFQMLTGFWVSKTLMTAVELEVFTKLSRGAKSSSVTLDELQDILGMERRPTEVFVTALVSLALLKVADNTATTVDEKRYSNSEIADTFLNKNNKPSYMGDLISMYDKGLYKSWDKLSVSLKMNKPIDEKEGGDAEGIFIQAKSDQAVEQIQKFTHAMYGVSVGPAIALTKVFDFSKYKRMMDIGGGSGVYAIQVVKNNPNMSAIVLDLKSVCQVADQYIEEFNLQEQINTKPLDFFKEELPKDCDIAFLSLIIHDYNEEKDRSLSKKVYDSLPNENGAIIISDWLLNDEKTGPIPAALMSLNMIMLTSGGRNYSFVEISRMLSDVGFKNIEKRPLAGPAQIVIGYKNKKK